MPTTIVYSQPGNNSGEAWDGSATRGVGSAPEPWSVIRAGLGTSAQASSGATNIIYLATDYNPSLWTTLTRGIVGMNTTVLSPSSSIQSATLYLKCYSNFCSVGFPCDSCDMYVTSYTPGNIISTASYNINRYGTQVYSSAAFSTIQAGTWISLTIPASVVNKGSNTYFGVLCKADFLNVDPAPTRGRTQAYVRIYYADTDGTADDPYMVVVHDTSAGAGAQAILV